MVLMDYKAILVLVDLKVSLAHQVLLEHEVQRDPLDLQDQTDNKLDLHA